MKTFNIEEIINKQPIGSIYRLFIIFCCRNDSKSEAAFRCINRRLSKMSSNKRDIVCKELILLYSTECLLGNLKTCKHYFKNGYLTLKK